MSNRPFEEQLRERLDQHPTPLDLDALWNEVEPRLPQKRKRITPFWIWSILGLALLGSLYLLAPATDEDAPVLQTEQRQSVPKKVLSSPAPSQESNIAPAAAPKK